MVKHWSWDNVISFSVIGLYGIPWIRYLLTFDSSELYPFWGMIATMIVNESIKYGLIGTASPRPKEATDCNLWVNDGPQGGRPGAPSGHSAQVSFFVGYYLQRLSVLHPTLSPLSLVLIRAGLVLYALLVMLSRWTKRCHTLGQIVSGSALGTLLSVMMVRHL